jgi:hypothetical protein
MSKPADRFYVYTLCTPDGTPFYVGKGQGSRIANHESEARSGECICAKCRTIRTIWAQGQAVRRHMVFVGLEESEAFRRERELIIQIGLDSLTNKTITAGRPPSGKPRKVKIAITLASDLLSAIDRLAEERHATRSAVIEAATRYGLLMVAAEAD